MNERTNLELQELEVLLRLVFIDVQHRSTVAAAVAVVWRREQRQRVSSMTPIVSVHHQLVGATHGVQTVLVVPIARHVFPKRESGTSRTLT